MKKWLLGLSMGAVVWAAPGYTSQGVHFECPYALSAPSSAGLHCEIQQYPADAKLAQVQLEVLHYRPSLEEEQKLSTAGQSSLQYFLTTFLGLTQQPEQINKIVLGGKGGRHLVFYTTHPRAARVDVFERQLSDGSSFVATVSYEESPKMPEAVLQISRTLRYPE